MSSALLPVAHMARCVQQSGGVCAAHMAGCVQQSGGVCAAVAWHVVGCVQQSHGIWWGACSSHMTCGGVRAAVTWHVVGCAQQSHDVWWGVRSSHMAGGVCVQQASTALRVKCAVPAQDCRGLSRCSTRGDQGEWLQRVHCRLLFVAYYVFVVLSSLCVL